ncbi:MAG: haloacid dehalogenase type II [Leucothrix sp.]
MATSLAFDVYGTLIDTHGVVDALRLLVGDDARLFSQQWREKQLEYSFRRGLMDDYVDFSVCTRQALDYTAATTHHLLTEKETDGLMQVYTQLPAFDDVLACLTEAQSAGARLFAFSNGSSQAVEALLQHAGIRDFFEGVISVEGVKTFKPNPRVYDHFVEATHSDLNDCCLVSSNSFDVLGALNANWRAVWVQRDSHVQFDPWGVQPTATVDRLTSLHQVLSAAS